MSSEDQNLARQKQQLLEIGMNIIFEEKNSGTSIYRKLLEIKGIMDGQENP